MKTLMLRVCYLGLAVSTLIASPGAEEPASAEPTDPVADVLKPLKILDADALAESDMPAPLALAAAADTNGPPQTNPAVNRPASVQEPVAPANVKLSPAMAEVVKLIHAGVSPDVLMAYITNSTSVFNVDSDVIVYLNDLGVTNTVITALIHHDSSPESAARKASATAAQPLPPGVSTTSPVTNVYPAGAQATFPPPGQTTYPGDLSNVTDTNVPADVAGTEPPTVTAPLATGENVTVNYFYSSLAPYGSWVDLPGYGLCWRPTVSVVNPYWRPYSDSGRWLWSDAGWYWYSDYSWGWAPFHYGRWCSYPSYGWVWVPGSVWAPSWVTWRYYDGYCGWAPLPPGCGYRAGYGLTWYGSGVAIGFGWGLGAHCYTYVPTHRFCDWYVSRHSLPSHGIHVVHRNSVNVNRIHTRNNAIVNDGIDPNTIAKVSRSRIPTAKIKDQTLPADARVKPERLDTRGDNVAIVRPQLPRLQPGARPAVVRGTGANAKPVSLANSTQSTAPATATRSTQTPTPSTVAAPRPNVKNITAPANGGRNSGVGDVGTGKRPDAVASAPAPNAASQPAKVNPSTTRQAPANRPTVTPPANRPQTATPNVQRQTAPGQDAIARNNITPRQNPSPSGRSLTPPAAQPARPAAQPTRPTPQQAAPTRSVSPMIRSYAQPQASVPSAAVPRSAQPSFRPAPMASPPASHRPQFSAPPTQAPRQSVAPPASAPVVRSAPPSVSRSAPSGGGGGGGGGRVAGGGNGSGGRGGPR